MQILIAAAIVSLVINITTEEDKKLGVLEPTAIFLAVAACTLVAAVNDY